MKDSVLAARLLKLSERLTWDEIAQLDDYKPIPVGTLWAIAHGRIIRNPVYRDFLGLDQHESCGQCWQFKKYIGVARRLRRKPTKLYQMSKTSLRIAFENREIIQDGSQAQGQKSGYESCKYPGDGAR